MFKAIQEQITSLYKEKRQPLLLAVDESQYLNIGILNDIKMLRSSVLLSITRGFIDEVFNVLFKAMTHVMVLFQKQIICP